MPYELNDCGSFSGLIIPGRKRRITSRANRMSAFRLPELLIRSAYSSRRSPSIYFFTRGWQNHRKNRRKTLGGDCGTFISSGECRIENNRWNGAPEFIACALRILEGLLSQ